jgi:uncharacterized RDD family membrane protein YckC
VPPPPPSTPAPPPPPPTPTPRPPDAGRSDSSSETNNAAETTPESREPAPRYEPKQRADLSDLLDKLGDGTEGYTPDLSDALTDPRDLERPKTSEVVIESTGAINFRPEFASFGARFVGFAIDMAVTLLAMAPGILLLVFGSGILLVLGVLLALVGYLIAGRAYAKSVAASGQWIGNRVMSTSVVDVSSGRPITSSNAAARFAARSLISPVLLFGFLMAFGHNSRRTFHDQLASSVVIRPARAVWSADDAAAPGDGPEHGGQ